MYLSDKLRELALDTFTELDSGEASRYVKASLALIVEDLDALSLAYGFQGEPLFDALTKKYGVERFAELNRLRERAELSLGELGELDDHPF